MTGLPHWAEVVEGVESVVWVDDGEGFSLGAQWRETWRMYGRTATEEMEVTAVEPSRSYITQARNSSTVNVSMLSAHPHGDDASVLSMTFDARTGGLVASTATSIAGSRWCR